TGRFVLVDDYEICGGGIVLDVLPDEDVALRDQLIRRNLKWESSRVSRERRSEKYNQRSTLVLVTGEQGAPRKEIAKALEQTLFEDGRIVYFLAMASVKYGVDADLLDRA